MHTDTGTFAGRIEPGDARFGPLVGADATHLIMRTGANGNGGLDWIEAGEFHGECPDLREPFENALAAKVP